MDRQTPLGSLISKLDVVESSFQNSRLTATLWGALLKRCRAWIRDTIPEWRSELIAKTKLKVAPKALPRGSRLSGLRHRLAGVCSPQMMPTVRCVEPPRRGKTVRVRIAGSRCVRSQKRSSIRSIPTCQLLATATCKSVADSHFGSYQPLSEEGSLGVSPESPPVGSSAVKNRWHRFRPTVVELSPANTGEGKHGTSIVVPLPSSSNAGHRGSGQRS